MEELTHLPQITIKLLGLNLVINTETIIMTWIVMGALVVFGLFSRRSLSILPNPFQILAEIIVKAFWDLTKDALDDDLARKYFPLICTMFLFLLIGNWLGVFPHLAEPTKDLNTPLGLGIMGFFIAHYAGIRAKGFKRYAKDYFEPIFLMAPLNMIGEIAKVVSISFRLYGNIMGGAIIVLVVSHLVYSLILPPFLIAFFSLFIGTIQAFVFTMLTLVYISVQVK
ncbi:MAG: F0F1 ATP synthase subunit A [Desulfobacteraceae bacterium]